MKRNGRKTENSRRARAMRRRNGRMMWLASILCAAAACIVLIIIDSGSAPASSPQPVPSTTPAIMAPTARPGGSTLAPAASLATRAASATPAATPAPTPTGTTAYTPAPTLRSATIRSVGDFVIHDEILKSARVRSSNEYDFADMLSMVAPELSNASYTVANVDGVMQGDAAWPYAGYPSFNTPPELMAALKSAGIDMLTLANNHALDYYFDGLKAAIDRCEEYQMDFVGGARTQMERDTPVIRDIGGISVGFLNYTDNLNRKEQYSDREATVYGVLFVQDADISGDIAALRAAGAEVVIVYMHWGTEYQSEPDDTQREYAQIIAEAGADAIMGSHPHMVQSIEWIDVRLPDGSSRRCLCAYSLGNFLADKRSEERDTGIILEMTISETQPGVFEIEDPTYIVTYIWRYGGSSGPYDYRVVVCDDWLSQRPDDMTERVQGKVAAAHSNTMRLLEGGAARPRGTAGD